MTSEENDKTLPEATEQEQEEQIERGPGHLLRKKREALGLSVQEAADALHITMHYVRSLESDAHDKLPGDVFIKGYLRAYAGLLGLDSTVLINVYNEYTNQREDADMASLGRRRRRRNRNTPWIVFSGIAFVVVAIVLWYFSADSNAAARTGAIGVSGPTLRTALAAISSQVAGQDEAERVQEVPMLVEPGQPIVVPLEVKEPAQTLQSALPPTTVEASTLEFAYPDEQEGAGLVSGALPEALAKLEEEMTADISSVEAFEGLPMLESVGSESAALQTAYDNEPGNVIRIDAGGEDVVQIRFSAESMVQVQDASEEQVYRDVRIAGDVLRIHGTAPFNILLGEASHATLSFNGEEIDFSASIRIDNSARLTVGL